MENSTHGIRWTVLGLGLGLALALPPAGGRADDDGKPLPAPAGARELPEPTEAGSLPEGTEAGSLPTDPDAEGRPLPAPTGARDVPEGEEARPGPRDPRPPQPPPARGELLPAPLDAPVPPDVGDDRAFWETRKEAAAANLARIRQELAETEDAFTQACRYQGGDRCQKLRDRAHVLRRQEAALERYLDDGLHEECRKNGCLPGWIRG